MCQQASRDDNSTGGEQHAEGEGVDPRCLRSVETYDDDAVVAIEFFGDPRADFQLYALLYELDHRHYAQVLLEHTFPRYPDIASPPPETQGGLVSLELYHETGMSTDPEEPLEKALAVVESAAGDLDGIRPAPIAVLVGHSEYESLARWVAEQGRNCIIKGPGVGQSDDLDFNSHQDRGFSTGFAPID